MMERVMAKTVAFRQRPGRTERTKLFVPPLRSTAGRTDGRSGRFPTVLVDRSLAKKVTGRTSLYMPGYAPSIWNKWII
jgi:hypothetical protein